MVLKYMITDTDLAEGDLGPPESEAKQSAAKVEQPEKKVVLDWRRQRIEPKWAAPSSKKSLKSWFFLMAILRLLTDRRRRRPYKAGSDRLLYRPRRPSASPFR